MLINPTAVTSTTATPSSAASGKQIITGDDFMTLLVAQLTNQDPMSPMDSEAFISQLSQLEMVSQLSDIKSILQSTGSYTDLVSTLGRTVYWTEVDGSSASGEVTALVEYGDTFMLHAGDRLLNFSDIIMIE
jgi:flagellar basal-body rod modification protein FlgD